MCPMLFKTQSGERPNVMTHVIHVCIKLVQCFYYVCSSVFHISFSTVGGGGE